MVSGVIWPCDISSMWCRKWMYHSLLQGHIPSKVALSKTSWNEDAICHYDAVQYKYQICLFAVLWLHDRMQVRNIWLLIVQQWISYKYSLVKSVITWLSINIDINLVMHHHGHISLCKVSYSTCRLTHRQLKKHGSIISTVTTDVLVLRHQAISSHSADSLLIVDQFHAEMLHLQWTTLQTNIVIWKQKYLVI